MTRTLTDTEMLALETANGSPLVTVIPDKNFRDVFGTTVPGLAVYRRLEKLDLLFFTEEEPMDDGFVFTQMLELTDAGRVALKTRVCG
jgi:hypothetical protein